MKICIAHHHMYPGGVTQVILNQIKALSAYENLYVELWLGEPPQKHISLPKSVKVRVNPLLSYARVIPRKSKLEKQILDLKSWMSSRLLKKDILHIHNLNLGKSPLINLAVYQLALSGQPVINHCHDFAEDGRPANMNSLKKAVGYFYGDALKQVLYPNLSNYLYAVINGRDHDNLKKIGIKKNQIYLLTNPVEKSGNKDSKFKKYALHKILKADTSKGIWVYPVRGIRRKNLGEMLLMSALFSKNHIFGITQPPRNPQETASYRRWKKFALQLGIAFEFELGERADFELIKSQATGFFTSSVSEGFGMAFLEPWTWGKTLVGRDIPAITSQFKKMGVRFPKSYVHLWVPYSWVVEKRQFWKKIRAFCEGNYKANGLCIPQKFGPQIQKSLLYNGNIDFCYLDEMRQQAVIKRVQKSPSSRQKILELNRIANIFTPISKREILDNNNCISKKFSIENYGKVLWNIYQFLYSHKNLGKSLKNTSHVSMSEVLSDPTALHLIRK